MLPFCLDHLRWLPNTHCLHVMMLISITGQRLPEPILCQVCAASIEGDALDPIDVAPVCPLLAPLPMPSALDLDAWRGALLDLWSLAHCYES